MVSFWHPSKARLPRTLGSYSAPGTHSKHNMMPRNVAFGSKLIKLECRCVGMLPSEQRVRAQAPLPHPRVRAQTPLPHLKVRGWRPAGTRGGALRRPSGHPRRRSGGAPATLLGSELIKFGCRCLGMLPSEVRVRAQAPFVHLKGARVAPCRHPRRPSPHPRVRSDVPLRTQRALRCPSRTPGRAQAPFSAPKGAQKGCFPHPGGFVPIEKKKKY